MMPVLLNAHLNAKYPCWFRPGAPAMRAAPKRAHHLSITLFGACPISASLEQLEKCSNIGAQRQLCKKWTLTFSLLFAHSFPVTPKIVPC
jgi:hypothetical protein